MAQKEQEEATTSADLPAVHSQRVRRLNYLVFIHRRYVD